MKRLSTVLLLIVLVVAPAMASGWIGLETGPSFTWETTTISIGANKEKGDVRQFEYYAGVAGAHYFSNNLGLGYSFGMIFPISSESDGVKTDMKDSPKEIISSLSFNYKNDISRMLMFELGLGAYVSFMSKDFVLSGSMQTMEIKIWQFGAKADASFSVRFANAIALKAGVKAIVPILTRCSAEISVLSIEPDITNYGIDLMPYLGFSFCY